MAGLVPAWAMVRRRPKATAARWTRRRAASACAPIPDLTYNLLTYCVVYWMFDTLRDAIIQFSKRSFGINIIIFEINIQISCDLQHDNTIIYKRR